MLISRYRIYGSKRLSNIVVTGLIYAISFYMVIHFSSEIFIKTFTGYLSYFPQGLVLLFYGILGQLFSFYSILSIYYDVGSGYNEFNKKENIIRIFRWGFPGPERSLNLCYPLSDIKSLKITTNSPETLYLCFKGNYEIPLSISGPSNNLNKLEKEAIKIASFLGVPITFL